VDKGTSQRGGHRDYADLGGISMSTTTTENNSKPRRQQLNESRVWQVYARRKYEEPLHEIGNVMADDVELAKVYARSIYDEFSWVEMVIIPRESIVTVIAS
jgi:1,2-phenylacetyl-CoA epoxidase PaaB subunit